MMDSNFDDTHLCIKCNLTIVGLENYIQHRKQNCGNISGANSKEKIQNIDHNRERLTDVPTTIHSYDSFPYAEPEAPSSYVNKTQHGAKTPKSLGDTYDLTYELGADVFFSSLQLQSVQSSGGKTPNAQQTPLQRQKTLALPQDRGEADTWIDSHDDNQSSSRHNTDSLMTAVNAMSDVKKPYEEIFKSIEYEADSPSGASEVDDIEIEEEDADYDPIASGHESCGKWKLSPMHHSPPVVPANYTGGKWKPEHRPLIRATHSQVACLSPNWGDDHIDEVETPEIHSDQFPPADHTRGKWVPGTKVQRIEYKDEVELDKPSTTETYWCNICCRKLKTKINYENHLKTSYHLKRAEPEQELERAELQQGSISKNFAFDLELKPKKATKSPLKKRKRRAKFIKCELCRYTTLRWNIGKHLISHYHYRRMRVNPSKAVPMILKYIHSIVQQSPFQCRPCRFYSNTENAFLLHWNSPEHFKTVDTPGKLWCSYCRFECDGNSEMLFHLLDSEHQEVILAFNRSVPICISKKLPIRCFICGMTFRYNVELRAHVRLGHPGTELPGTSSDVYQSRFKCDRCGECLRSKIALQRHEKFKHDISKYFCAICHLEFETTIEAKKHRRTTEHRKNAKAAAEAMESEANKKKCSDCEFVATSEVEKLLHELTHPKDDISEDLLKLRKALESPSTATHQGKRHKLSEQILVKCKDCTEVFHSREELKVHRDAAHPLLSHICTNCGKSFALAQALGRHTRICETIVSAEPDDPAGLDNLPATSAATSAGTRKTWSCEKCNFVAPLESELIFHNLHHIYGTLDKTTKIKCPLCPKSFPKYSLRCHLRQHTNEKVFACTFCEQKFARSHNLKDHIKNMHRDKQQSEEGDATEKDDPKPFHCNICEKQYKTKYALNTHILSHSESVTFKYQCTHKKCEYRAKTKALLQVHLASHSKKKLKCDRKDCNYVGKSPLHLKRHALTHSAPKHRFACDECNFRTDSSTNFQRHKRSHNGEKPFKCRHCDFQCSDVDYLRKHILKTKKHPGTFLYECGLCDKNSATQEVFKTNSHLMFQRHLKIHSQNEAK